MNINAKKELLKQFKKGYSKTFLDGLKQGVVSVSKVILDRAKNENKSPEERIADIIKLCEAPLKNLDGK